MRYRAKLKKGVTLENIKDGSIKYSIGQEVIVYLVRFVGKINYFYVHLDSKKYRVLPSSFEPRFQTGDICVVKIKRLSKQPISGRIFGFIDNWHGQYGVMYLMDFGDGLSWQVPEFYITKRISKFRVAN